MKEGDFIMKNVIVTGCLGGIGKAVTKKFLAEGYSVCGMSRSDREKAYALIDHENFTFVSGDVADKEARELLVKTAVDTYGRIDVLVNVAGVAPRVRADILEMTEESYDFVMNINTKGALFLTQSVANIMKNNSPCGDVRGYICNISSLSAYTSSVSRGEYCISKAGMSMITKLFADRLANDGINVNEICPGIISTDMTSAVKEKYDKLIANGLVPLGRWGTPDDIAKAVLALCDGTFGYMTGESLILDGGMHIRKL